MPEYNWLDWMRARLERLSDGKRAFNEFLDGKIKPIKKLGANWILNKQEIETLKKQRERR